MKNIYIKEIEDHYNINLQEIIEDDEVYSKVEFYKNGNKYSLNSKGDVIKLNLKDNNIDNIQLLYFLKDTLTYLNLSGNKLEEIEILEDFNELIFLDLSTNFITDIRSIADLIKIEQLYLDNNRISVLPKLNMPNLYDLMLHSNNIEVITNLKHSLNLYSINISNNKIENINALGKLEKLKVVDLSKNNISDINVLNNLKSLYSINLSSNKINNLSAFSKFESFEILNLENNQVEEITPLKSIAIKELFIGENNIIDLSPLYSSLKTKKIGFLNVNNSPNLLFPTEGIAKRGEEKIVEWLDIMFENIEKCKQKINEIKNKPNSKIISLDIGMMGLTDLSLIPELFELENLEELILSNHYAEYRENGEYWEKVQSKNNFYPNNLSSIPNDIKKLKKLKKLIIGGDWKDGDRWNRWRIIDITPVFSLKELEYLNVSNNKIEKIKVTNRVKLSKLKVIHLNNNEISTFYTLTKYPNLEELYLSNNELTRVTNLANIRTLKTIDLHGNKIESIKPLLNLLKETNINISDAKWEKNTINIKDNPLEEPNYETIYSGKEAVVRYFVSLTDWKTVVNKEIKLVLVGNSEAGKTTLVKYLDAENNLEKKHDATHWMEEKEVTSKHIIDKIKEKCNLRVFDFGGQDYYHDTHHIFFTNNTIYLLLWEESTNNLKLRKLTQTVNGKSKEIETQDYPIMYWLESVKHFIKEESNIKGENIAKYEYNSNLLLIQNKVSKANAIKPQNNMEIKDSFPFVSDFININILEPRRNLVHFDNMLTEIINEMDVVGSNILEYQDTIRKEIKNYNGKPILSLSEFKKYCNEHLPKEIKDGELEDLCSYLKQLGLIFYYKEDPKKNVYIDKNWVLTNMYKILEGLDTLEGEFDNEYIRIAIGLYSKQKNISDNSLIDSLIDLMTRFKIIFHNPKNKKHIAPLYLPKKPLDGVNLFLMEKRIPYRRFEYKGFIHKTIILDFFQKYGKNTLGDEKKFYYWKDGLIIKDIETSQILHIEFNIGNEYGNAYIDIFKLNETDKKNFFVSEVIESIKKINKEFKIDDEDFEEMVTIDGNYYAKIKELILKKQKNIRYISLSNENSIIETNVSNFDKFLPPNNRSFLKKAIISYSKKDLRLIEEFKLSSLGSLIQDELLDEWYCTDLIAGEIWNDEIQNRVHNCDIAFIMISKYSMNTDYIKNKEIKILIDRFNNPNENAKPIIIPIILEPYHWTSKNEKYNLGQFSALPYTAKPVIDFKLRSQAWYIIGECIRIAIENKIDSENLIGKEYWKDYWSIREVGNDVKDLFIRLIEGKLNNDS